MSTCINMWRTSIIHSLGTRTAVTGLLLGAGTIIPELQFLVIGGCALFIYVASTVLSLKYAAWFGFGSWTIKSLLSLWWFWSVYPIATVSIDSSLLQIAIICFSWVVSATALGSGGAIAAIAIFYLYQKSGFFIIPTTALVWVAAEVFGSLVFSVVTSGPGSYMQAYFSFGYIGYQAISLPGMIGWATLGGVYILSVVVVVVSGILLVMIRKRVVVLGLSSIGIVMAVGMTLQPDMYEKKVVTIAVVDTRYPAGYEEEVRSESLSGAVDAAITTNSDFILLPEDSRYLDRVFNENSRVRSQLQYAFTHASTKATVIDSARTTTGEGDVVLRASLFSGAPGIIHEVDKQYLVPQGEFIPYAFRFIMGVSGFGDTLVKNETIGQFVPGPYTKKTTQSSLPSILFCMESVRPTGVMNLQSSAPFIAHPISHAWFHEPVTLWPQLDSMVQIQSVWSGVPIVSAANMAIGKVYYPDGVIEIAPTVATEKDWTVRLITL